MALWSRRAAFSAYPCYSGKGTTFRAPKSLQHGLKVEGLKQFAVLFPYWQVNKIAKLLILLVGSTGIEPVTPTMSR
jgi:hypothetical protein